MSRGKKIGEKFETTRENNRSELADDARAILPEQKAKLNHSAIIVSAECIVIRSQRLNKPSKMVMAALVARARLLYVRSDGGLGVSNYSVCCGCFHES